MSLQLYAVGDVTGSIAANGSAVNVALATPGQRGVLTFTGTPGQIVSATMTALSPTWFPNSWSVTLVGPTGAILGSGFGCCANTVAFMEDVTLQDPGTYQLIVDPASNFTGSVAVRLFTVTHVTGPIATGGTPLTLSLPTPGANAYLTFTGTQGQHVSFSGTNGTIAYQESGCDVWAGLRDDTTNTWVAAASSVCLEVSGSGGPATLPSTGVYNRVEPLHGGVFNKIASGSLDFWNDHWAGPGGMGPPHGRGDWTAMAHHYAFMLGGIGIADYFDLSISPENTGALIRANHMLIGNAGGVQAAKCGTVFGIVSAFQWYRNTWR